MIRRLSYVSCDRCQSRPAQPAENARNARGVAAGEGYRRIGREDVCLDCRRDAGDISDEVHAQFVAMLRGGQR